MSKFDSATVPSYYEHTRNIQTTYEGLAGDISADVVVIGGGLTGCSSALHLAQNGVDVALVESRHIGWGASGRSGGQIINGYACETDVLEKMLGQDLAQELWQHSVQAVEYTRELVDKHSIDCDLTMGYIHAGVKPRQAKNLEEWAEDLSKNYGYEVMTYLDKHELKAILNSDLYAGGVFDSGSGHLHPLNYCVGLGHAASMAGVKIYERTRVKNVAQKVSSGTNSKVVQCDSGSISCQQVIYACNAYIDGLAPEISSKTMPVGTYIVATEPLKEEVALSLISNRAAIADTNFVLDYFRLSADNRLLFGGRVSYSTLQPRGLTDSLRKRMLRVFPQLQGVKIEFSWGGYVSITQNRAPSVGQMKNGGWYAQGYSGHGMALTGYMGNLLASAILGERDQIEVFEKISHTKFPGGKLLRTPALVAAMGYYKLKDRF